MAGSVTEMKRRRCAISKSRRRASYSPSWRAKQRSVPTLWHAAKDHLLLLGMRETGLQPPSFVSLIERCARVCCLCVRAGKKTCSAWPHAWRAMHQKETRRRKLHFPLLWWRQLNLKNAAPQNRGAKATWGLANLWLLAWHGIRPLSLSEDCFLLTVFKLFLQRARALSVRYNNVIFGISTCVQPAATNKVRTRQSLISFVVFFDWSLKEIVWRRWTFYFNGGVYWGKTTTGLFWAIASRVFHHEYVKITKIMDMPCMLIS